MLGLRRVHFRVLQVVEKRWAQSGRPGRPGRQSPIHTTAGGMVGIASAKVVNKQLLIGSAIRASGTLPSSRRHFRGS